ncbi:MAG: hypothetical protein Q7S59_03160 [Sulfurimonas sp.]|nr:hypothetical protein [Sulfurimonas sp.]
MTCTKPNIEEFKHKGLSLLNLDGLKTKNIEELEAQNPNFLFEPNYDYDNDDSLFGYYVQHKYLAPDAGSWRISCQRDEARGFSVDLDGEDYGSFQSFIDVLECIE